MQDLVGRHIGQYQIAERLGRGGMASVYRAVQPSLNRSVAIKVLPPGLAMDPTFLERFRREATSVATLQHPNILPVYDFGQDGDLFYIVMMLVGGGTLRDRIGRIPLTLAVRLASQMTDALDFAHSQGIIHRDVKPTNVLMARDDWALLADFGIARLTEAAGLTSAGTGIGTPEYMSPEQAMGKPADGRADVYSMGILLFEMVVGKLPFSGEAFSVMRQQVQDPVPRASSVNPSVPPALDEIISRATQKDPAQRFQRASQMKEALDSLLMTSPSGNRALTDSLMGAAVSPAATVVSAPSSSNIPNSPSPEPGRSSGGNRGLIFLGVGAVLFGCICVSGLGALAYAGPKLLAEASTNTPTRTATPTARAGTTPGTATPGTGPSATRAPATATRPAASTATFTPIPVGRVVFQDDMTNSRNPNGWDTLNQKEVKSYFQNGTYHIENTDTNTNWVMFPRNNKTRYTSFVYEADVVKVDGPEDKNYGIAFRNEGVDGYSFFIRGDGVFQLTRYVDSLFKAGQGGFDRMIEPTRDSAGIVNQGNAKNRLKVVARGPEITIYVNDRWIGAVRETKEEARKDGTIGIISGPGVHLTVSAIRIFDVGG